MEMVGIFNPPDEKMRLDAVGPLAGYPIRVKKAIPALIPFFKPIPQPIAGDWLWENDEDGQSYPVYENSRKNYLDGKRKSIYVYPLEKDLDKEFLLKLKKILKAFYVGMKIKILDSIDITTRKITTRISQTTQKIQYHGPSIMEAVKNDLPIDGYGMMCILLKDIYNKVDTDDYGNFR